MVTINNQTTARKQARTEVEKALKALELAHKHLLKVARTATETQGDSQVRFTSYAISRAQHAADKLQEVVDFTKFEILGDRWTLATEHRTALGHG